MMDPATDRTYVPVGLIADALGYNVGWDGSNGTVILDDVDAILAANTETYELMDKYLDYSRTFAQKNQKVGGEYAMDISVSTSDGEQDMDIQFLADGDYDMITAGSTAFQFDTQMVLDYAASLNGVDATELLDSTGELPFPLTIDFAMRGDMEQGAHLSQLRRPEPIYPWGGCLGRYLVQAGYEVLLRPERRSHRLHLC